jgi:hypothetical protein
VTAAISKNLEAVEKVIIDTQIFARREREEKEIQLMSDKNLTHTVRISDFRIFGSR